MSRPIWSLLLLALFGPGCHLIYPFEVAPVDGGLADTDRPNAEGGVPDAGSDALDAGRDVLDADGGKGAPCIKSAECGPGLFCAGDVCCDDPCVGPCSTCKATGSVGTCSPVAAVLRKVCGSICGSSGSSEIVSHCDGKGVCLAGSPQPCAPFLLCDGAKGRCPAGCIDGADCVSGTKHGGTCDRSQAHLTGHGKCIDPTKVSVPPTAADLLTAIAAVDNISKTHVLLKPGLNYKLSKILIKGSAKSVTIIGDGSSIITSTVDGAATVEVLTVGTLIVQGVTLTHETPKTGHGASCQASGKLTILESAVTGNQGLGIATDGSCELVLRRSLVANNSLGGMKLAGGISGNTSTVVNNIVVNNGGSAATIGGVLLRWYGSPDPVLYNNTIADNTNGAGGGAGVICDTSYGGSTKYNLHNTIVWGNAPAAVDSRCAYHSSDVEKATSLSSGSISTAPQLNSDYSLPASSPCVDTGGKVPPGISVIAYKNSSRPLGKGTDMGAYER